MSAGRRNLLGIGLAALGLGALVLALATVAGSPADGAAAPATSRTAPPAHVPSAQVPPARVPAVHAPGTATAPAAAAAASPTVDDILAAGADGSVDAMVVLLTGVESADAVVVAEATNALVARGAVAALPVLVEHDILGRPWAAPSVIDALGRLAAIAAPDQRAEVIDRLVALMHEEKHRGAVESQGNVIAIYEALGQTGDPRAIGPLEGELVDPTVPTAPKVAVVQALVALRATRSRDVLARVQAQLAAAPLADGLEAELQRDLLVAIRDALVRLS